MQATGSRLVLVLHVIGWEGSASFLDKSEGLEFFQRLRDRRLEWRIWGSVDPQWFFLCTKLVTHQLMHVEVYQIRFRSAITARPARTRPTRPIRLLNFPQIRQFPLCCLSRFLFGWMYLKLASTSGFSNKIKSPSVDFFGLSASLLRLYPYKV